MNSAARQSQIWTNFLLRPMAPGLALTHQPVKVIYRAQDEDRALTILKGITFRKRDLSAAALPASRYFFSRISMEARVISHSSFMVQRAPAWSNEIVKFSSGDGNLETFISMRAKSDCAPG